MAEIIAGFIYLNSYLCLETQKLLAGFTIKMINIKYIKETFRPIWSPFRTRNIKTQNIPTVTRFDKNKIDDIKESLSFLNSNIPLLKIPYCSDSIVKTPKIASQE